MEKYARTNVNGLVLEVFSPPEGFQLKDCFHQVIAKQFQPCPDEVTAGFTLKNGKWIAPPEPEVVPEENSDTPPAA